MVPLLAALLVPALLFLSVFQILGERVSTYPLGGRPPEKVSHRIAFTGDVVCRVASDPSLVRHLAV